MKEYTITLNAGRREYDLVVESLPRKVKIQTENTIFMVAGVLQPVIQKNDSTSDIIGENTDTDIE